MAPPNVTQLTSRILSNTHFGHEWGPAPTYELTGWVKGELLVSQDAPKDQRDLLGQYGWGKKSSVLEPSKQVKTMPSRRTKEVRDIEIWGPKGPGTPVMVEAVVADFRAKFGHQLRVSPNHLLVPCGYGSYCPARAPRPRPLPSASALDALADKMATFAEGRNEVHVVVIDTGYIRKAPLELRRQRGGFDNSTGEIWNGNAWVPSPEDDAYRLFPGGPLEMLDGHGTFTVGEIAQRCPKVHVSVVGILDDEGATTEAAVARAIYLNADADVIVPVFAFPTLDGIENWTFKNVLPQLKKGSVVVCPAGNETSHKPHYPAALQWPAYPVVGIGSFLPRSAGAGPLSDFSNFGDWVFGYTLGEDVTGLYFKLKTRVEDSHPRNERWAFNGWASWSGTSFAAPKVAAVLANKAVSGTEPWAGAGQLRAAAQPVDLGRPYAIGVTGHDLRQLAK